MSLGIDRLPVIAAIATILGILELGPWLVASQKVCNLAPKANVVSQVACVGKLRIGRVAVPTAPKL